MKMFSGCKLLSAFATTAALSLAANAQTIVAQREISLGAARDMAVAAVEHCRKGGHRISVTIVDSGGQTRLFHRDDGAAPHTADASFKKAYTARTYRTAERRVHEAHRGRRRRAAGPPPDQQCARGSGRTADKIGDETIGGIGIAGAPGDGDEGCAQAAIDRVADQLK